MSFKIDAMFEKFGHTVLRLPPYHPDLNPIEQVWGVKKRAIASENVLQKEKQVKALIFKHFEGPSKELWENTCQKVEQTELAYLGNDLVVQFEVEVEEEEALLESSDKESDYSSSASTETASEDEMNVDFDFIIPTSSVSKL